MASVSTPLVRSPLSTSGCCLHTHPEVSLGFRATGAAVRTRPCQGLRDATVNLQGEWWGASQIRVVLCTLSWICQFSPSAPAVYLVPKYLCRPRRPTIFAPVPIGQYPSTLACSGQHLFPCSRQSLHPDVQACSRALARVAAVSTRCKPTPAPRQPQQQACTKYLVARMGRVWSTQQPTHVRTASQVPLRMVFVPTTPRLG